MLRAWELASHTASKMRLMNRRIAIVVAGIALVLFAMPLRAQAQDDFFSSSPGKLSSSHSSLEGQDKCTTCHTDGKSLSRDRCLGCHDHQNLGKRIAANKGFHASRRVKGKPCENCHKEHRGRGFDLMGWEAIGGQQKFDHTETGWTLEAKHKVLACKDCHSSRNRQGLRVFLSESKTCGDCHEKKQPHGPIRESLKRCERCHSQASWNPPLRKMKFDHSKRSDAAMPLEGTHLDVACSKCHPNSKFKLGKGSETCDSCHQSPHDGQLFGTKRCDLCHSPKERSLKGVRFAHKRQTKFALLGRHGSINCVRCHTTALKKRKPKTSCASCHASQNRHKDRFSQFAADSKSAPACETCHQPGGWKGQIFNHAENTKFTLTGKHQTVACRKCHRGKKSSEFEKFDVETVGCLGCHQHKEAHGGKYRNDECLGCHTEPGKKSMTKKSLEIFHGEKARFPLTLQHAKIKCERCHVGDVYESTPTECGARCHEDSLHRGRLGDACSGCHSPGKWEPERFSHKKNTDFPLKGRHKTVPACVDCHPDSSFTDTPRTCGARGCHQSDDIHETALGKECERCHTETGKTLFNHNRQAAFQIDGAHTLALCANCHTDRRFKPTAKQCSGCHEEPSIHKGRYGKKCESCHTTKSFGDIEETHDSGDFSLSGAHNRVRCDRCHKNGEKRRGSGDLCITCHRDDDVHQNSLSPRCGECHKQTAFLPVRFNHLSVGCNLPGLHRTLPCADCHKNGNFGAVSPLCANCHRGDSLRVAVPPHNNLVQCGDCHNTNAWLPMARLGRQSLCR